MWRDIEKHSPNPKIILGNKMIQTNESVYILSKDELDDIIKKAALAATKEALKRCGKKSDEEALWDAKQAGEYLGLSAWTVKYTLPAVHGFPAPITLSDTPKSQRRWRAEDIKRFAQRRQG